MAASPTDVRNLSLTCDFDEYEDAKIQPILDEAAMHINEKAVNVGGVDRYDTAHALLAAHLLTLAKKASQPARGAMVGSRLGPASRTYAKPTESGRENTSLRLNETGYGKRFQALLETLPLTPISVFE